MAHGTFICIFANGTVKNFHTRTDARPLSVPSLLDDMVAEDNFFWARLNADKILFVRSNPNQEFGTDGQIWLMKDRRASETLPALVTLRALPSGKPALRLPPAVEIPSGTSTWRILPPEADDERRGRVHVSNAAAVVEKVSTALDAFVRQTREEASASAKPAVFSGQRRRWNEGDLPFEVVALLSPQDDNWWRYQKSGSTDLCIASEGYLLRGSYVVQPVEVGQYRRWRSDKALFEVTKVRPHAHGEEHQVAIRYSWGQATLQRSVSNIERHSDVAVLEPPPRPWLKLNVTLDGRMTLDKADGTLWPVSAAFFYRDLERKWRGIKASRENREEIQREVETWIDGLIRDGVLRYDHIEQLWTAQRP